MKKAQWFKFFYCYKEAFYDLSGRQAKKLLIALIDYSEKGFYTHKLSKKAEMYFYEIQRVYEADIQRYREHGRVGGRNSKGVPKTHKNKGRVKGGFNE